MLINPDRVTLSAWTGHIPFAVTLITKLKPRIFVELGTHTGNSYLAFCQAVEEKKLDTKCYAVDTWAGDEHSFHYGEDVFRDLNEYHKNRYARFSTLMRMTFDAATSYFSDGTIDLLHIDGLHTYEAVKHDFEMWLPKMSERGVILFHDTNVRERNFGVFKFWEEIQPLYPHIEFDHSFGLGVLFVGKKSSNKIKNLISEWGDKRVKKLFAFLGERLIQKYEITALNQTVVEQDVRIEALSTELKSTLDMMGERDEQITALNQTVVEQDVRIEALSTELKSTLDTMGERDEQIIFLRRTIDELEKGVVERENVISEYKMSTSWRVTLPFRYVGYKYRFVQKIIKSAFKAILNIPAAISLWGVRGVSVKVIRRFREGGWRMLLGRSNAFHLLNTQYSPNKQIVEQFQKTVAVSKKSDEQQSLAVHTNVQSSSGLRTIVCIINEYDLMTQLYRVINYSEALMTMGYNYQIISENEVTDNLTIDADILVLNRIVWTSAIDALIQQFKKLERPVIFDIDDFVFDSSQIDLLRATNGGCDSLRQQFLSFMDGISKTMSLCDTVTVSTFALKEEVEKVGMSAYILPNNIGKKQIDLARQITIEKTANPTIKRIIRIGYFSGTKTHEEDFAECADALLSVLLDCSDVELLIVGHLDLPTSFNEIEHRIFRKPLMPYNDMLRELATIDINLAPLELNNAFTDCKSELKIFEAALFGIPTIASPTTTFSATVAHGRTGFLAASMEEWRKALMLLVRDKELRFQIGEAASNEIAPRYFIDTTVNKAKIIYEAALTKSLRQKFDPEQFSLPTEDRPLVTVVSILYRKAREVRYFLESLRRQDFPGRIEIILVDDQTPDESVAVVEDYRKWMRDTHGAGGRIDIQILSNKINIGNCGSRNLAINEARGDIVIVVDADCMINRSFLSYHYNAFLKGDSDVAIGPINIETHDRPPLSVLGQHEAAISLAEIESLPQDPINQASFVNCITRNFSIRRTFLKDVLQAPLFDESFSYSSDPQSGFGWEDVEMGYRLYVSGARIKYLPDTVSIHVSHESSANESEKPLRSLRNFRRLFNKHPDILLASRQWSIKTYEAILAWARSVGADLNNNVDYQWLEKRFLRYRQAPIIIDKHKKLRVLTYRWHVPHQYELYKTGHEFTLLTGCGTALCDYWEFGKRPMPKNCCMKSVDQVDMKDFDLAILHFDENVLRPDLCQGKVPSDWGETFRWFIDNVDLPKVAICHGTPQFIGQYDGAYKEHDLGQVLDDERMALFNILDDIPVVCNSYQAESEWGFQNSRTIWHGFDPSEFSPGHYCNDGVLVMQHAALLNRPHYNGLFVYEDVKQSLNGRVALDCLHAPDPSELYKFDTNNWAVAKYQNYVREMGKYSVYLNTTIRSPMPRSRGEAMMAGLISVSLQNHDVDMFIKNGINGFYANSSEELAEQIIWLSEHPLAREKIARESRNTAMNIFNQDRYLSIWNQLLSNILIGEVN